MKQMLGKNGRQAVISWIVLLATLTLHARTVSTPKLPPATFLDTEISTNVAITAWTGWTERMRSFKIVLSLDATPSNNVQVAFGVDMDADRLLSEEETKLTLGWDCGEWFVASAEHMNRFTATPSENMGLRREIGFTVHLESNDSPCRLDTFDNGIPITFAGLDDASPPEWLFSKAWNVLKVTARGVDRHNDHVSVRLNIDPVIFLLR